MMLIFGRFLLVLAVLIFDTGTAFEFPNNSYISHARRLYSHLMSDYMASIRPVNQSKEIITVHLDLKSFLVEDLDEKDQAFMFSGLMTQSWTDEQLMWTTEDFDRLHHIHIPISELWRPDITIINSKSAYFTLPSHHVAFVAYTGEVFWTIPINTKTHCELDLSEFPFDEHVCSVVFASWTHSDLTVSLNLPELYEDATNLLKYALNKNLEWELMNVTFARSEGRLLDMDSFSDVTYSFTIRRRSTFATHLFIGPSVMLCMVTPVVFLLPPGSGEKMIFGIGVLISDTLMFGELINYIPTSHPNLPLIAKYFLANIVMASLSLVISAIIIGFWDKSSSRLTGPHAFFRLIFLGPVATGLCVRKEDLISTDETSGGVALEINSEGEDGTESTSGVVPGTDNRRRFMTNYLRNAARTEWRQLVIVFDRLFFVIYCIIIAILTLSFARYI